MGCNRALWGAGGVAATPLRHTRNCGKSFVATPRSATGGVYVASAPLRQLSGPFEGSAELRNQEKKGKGFRRAQETAENRSSWHETSPLLVLGANGEFGGSNWPHHVDWPQTGQNLL